VPKNAIYDMAAALAKIGAYRFPLTFSPTTRAYFAKVAEIEGGEMGRAMKALVANPADRAAEAVVIGNPTYNAMLRTTCVATMVDGGHAPNALPQRVRATVNCRILPEDTQENVRATLIAQIANPDVSVDSGGGEDKQAFRPPSLDPAVIKPAEAVGAKIFPNMPLIPTLLIAETDGARLSAAGITTYGVPGMFLEPDMNGAHGRDEHVRISSLFNGRDYLYELVKLYAR
jgi:acetylornithine deacetylase/succinyl-diaminopimelate desuccinylase-like protein